MYRSSARLVKYLARKYDIPLDMQHIFGHDQIPGVTAGYVAGMHWDPGPYWNWEHYFQLLGAPLNAHAADGAIDLVRILPGFDANVSRSPRARPRVSRARRRARTSSTCTRPPQGGALHQRHRAAPERRTGHDAGSPTSVRGPRPV